MPGPAVIGPRLNELFWVGGVTYTNHYSSPSNSPAWTAGTDGSWTRNVIDFNGNLAAEVTASDVTLELPDLHGDIMATATATATGPTATYVYTEFGAPETGTPSTYGWLGADQISSNALGGQLLMGARAYSTAAGRFAQADPIPGGSANAYDYTFQNPLTEYDTSGAWSCYGGTTSSWFETCQLWLTGVEMDRLALAAGTAGLVLTFCAKAPVCALLLGIEAVLAMDAAYYDLARLHGNGAFIDVYFYRYVWRYPYFNWTGMHWGWGHSRWIPYWASFS